MASTRNILDCHDDHVGTATSSQTENLPKVSNIRTRKKKVELVGSSPSFVYDKFKLEEDTGPPQANDGQSSSVVENQLTSQNVCNEKEILNIINDFSEKKPCQVWLSNCLPRHLGLPMTSPPPSPRTVQVFVLCVGKPPFVATITDGGLDPDDFEEYCKNTARIIHWCLLDFCHLQFLLLPVCIKGSEFSKETLNSRLEECVEVVGRFFRKQIPLSETMFQKLTTAANAMTGATFVPSLLESSDPENLWILIMPRDWQTELFRMLQVLNRKGAFDVNVPSNQLPDSAQMIVVLEAAFRMCFTENVLITSNSDALGKCVELYQTLVREAHGVELQLSHQCLTPSGGHEESESNEVLVGVKATSEYQRLIQTMYEWMMNGEPEKISQHPFFTCPYFVQDMQQSFVALLNTDIISNNWMNLRYAWESFRRTVFCAAVEQRMWLVVKHLADHALYDDERWWALEEAYKHKAWDVMLQLAEHGLTEIELMRVRYRLAKHADWDVVCQMLERGVDVTEVREVVESTVKSRKTKTTTDRATQQALAERSRQLRQQEEILTHASDKCFKLPLTSQQWSTVLFRLHRHPGIASTWSQPSKTFGELLLRCAIKQRLWHVVMHLLRLDIGIDHRDSLFTDMIRRRQWGVCRVLMEQPGLSVQSYLGALSVFMEMNQWTLVAIVIEFIHDDCIKCQVMQRAMERREGSVVGQCIGNMKHYRMSIKEREELFQRALGQWFLQAVKPLVEWKDEVGIRHRDTALLSAIENHQWDVVDCCQLYGADINMKDEYGETPLNRATRNKAWKTVEKLLTRGGNPNHHDNKGFSVLHEAVANQKWDIVKLAIECLGNIHQPAPTPSANTPLQMLISARQEDIIDLSLVWCPDQSKVVNDVGESTLHAVALGKKPELFYHQIVRGVNPLALTHSGHSVLSYAVQNVHCPQRMVGECIRLGFSTHQPALSLNRLQTDTTIMEFIVNYMYASQGALHKITSPFLIAVLNGQPVIAHMLYESGACSYSELLHAYTLLLDLSDPYSECGRRLLVLVETEHTYYWGRYSHTGNQRYENLMNNILTFLPYLREMASTPRSLVSTCRLVISHCLTVRRRRERDVKDLPEKTLTDRMKAFLLFSDLTDPDYQWFLYGTLPQVARN